MNNVRWLVMIGALWVGLVLSSATVVAGDVFNGEKVYLTQCINCHGVAGESGIPGVPNFARGERMIKPDLELRRAILSGVGVMPGFNNVLSDEEIDNVITYIRSFL